MTKSANWTLLVAPAALIGGLALAFAEATRNTFAWCIFALCILWFFLVLAIAFLFSRRAQIAHPAAPNLAAKDEPRRQLQLASWAGCFGDLTEKKMDKATPKCAENSSQKLAVALGRKTPFSKEGERLKGR